MRVKVGWSNDLWDGCDTVGSVPSIGTVHRTARQEQFDTDVFCSGLMSFVQDLCATLVRSSDKSTLHLP